MPKVEINGPTVTVTALPERPTHFYLTETVATTRGPDGEKIEVMRPINNPFLLILRGAKNEAEIDLNSMVQETLLHVVQANDYSVDTSPGFGTPDAIVPKKETTSGLRIGVDLLGSGWAAILYVDVVDDVGSYTDVQQTGVGRYKTRKEAAVEARMWAKSDGYPLVEGFTDD